MKVIHTVSSLKMETGGPARSVPGLAGALARAGAEVSLTANERPDSFRAPEGVAFLSGGTELPSLQAAAAEMIHDHGLWLPSNYKVAQLASAMKTPRVVSPRGMLEPWALEHRKWKKRLAWWLYQKRCLKSAAALHATSDAEAEQFRRLGLKMPVIVLPNGVDLPEIPDEVAEAAPHSSRRTALFLSRIHPKKGLPLLLDAWARVKPQDWDLHIVGPDEGGHLADLQKQAKQLGLGSDLVRFSGPLDGAEKAAAFREASLFVLPTYSENFGIAAAEALAHGLPVITTHGAPWQVLETERCGWWVPVEGDAIAKALLDASARPEAELREMGRRGKEMVAARYSWDGIAREMLACYQWLLGRGSKPRCVV
ncbi:glycosyltransferase [Luteolibacter luteus]|uniref:Glycosyltransferase n=1 Tax=Luteolibacter luteus TaxID=2728835 RepID=A0A858RDN7_9BACT|nr:glycosyltransferase [Luteolibacter luteus]QJE94293.1 glycosyltransferase [Luteolibacter luteus]